MASMIFTASSAVPVKMKRGDAAAGGFGAVFATGGLGVGAGLGSPHLVRQARGLCGLHGAVFATATAVDQNPRERAVADAPQPSTTATASPLVVGSAAAAGGVLPPAGGAGRLLVHAVTAMRTKTIPIALFMCRSSETETNGKLSRNYLKLDIIIVARKS